MIPATMLLILSATGGAFDILYLHIWKYKLYSQARTLREHKIHTWQAATSGAVVFFLVCRNFQGLALLLGCSFVLADIVIEVLDVYCEKESRAHLGGLPSLEYALHITMSGGKFAFIALALAAKPSSAWSLSGAMEMPADYPLLIRFAGWCVFAFGVATVALQLWLQQPRFREESSRR